MSLQSINANPVTKKVSATTGHPGKIHTKIFLIGMPGSGKSHWGQVLRKKLQFPFYDLDNIVEVMEENTVTEIFAEKGEEYFRKAETKMLRLFSDKKQFILATGGGTPCTANNMQWMNKTGITIWINEPLAVLEERILIEKENRPLFAGKNKKEIGSILEQKLAERKQFYELATYKVDGIKISEERLLEIIKQHA